MTGDPWDPKAVLADAVAQRKNGHAANGLALPPRPATWPKPLGDAAYHGLAGDFVRLVEPETEADPAAVMFQFLAAAGNCFGDKAWFTVEKTRHFPNLFEIIAGDTSKARKGTSLRWVLHVLEEAAPEWRAECTTSGLSTGEGLIERVKDPVYEKDKRTGAIELVDPGAKDKRLLVREEEFSRPIRAMNRHENTLAPVLQQAWDGNRLGILTRNHPIKASNTTISIIGQITIDQLREELSDIQTVSGFANRFLFVVAKRSKELPFGGDVGDGALSEIAARLRSAINHERPIGLIRFDEIARHRWIEIYHELSTAHPGLYGAVTARSEAQVVRVALIYTLLDEQSMIGLAHLEAALEIVRYANASARHIFGDFTGNRVADTILRALRQAAPDPFTRTEISELFGRNVKADDLAAALTLLVGAGKIQRDHRTSTGGRPTELWKAVQHDDNAA